MLRRRLSQAAAIANPPALDPVAEMPFGLEIKKSRNLLSATACSIASVDMSRRIDHLDLAHRQKTRAANRSMSSRSNGCSESRVVTSTSSNPLNVLLKS